MDCYCCVATRHSVHINVFQIQPTVLTFSHRCSPKAKVEVSEIQGSSFFISALRKNVGLSNRSFQALIASKIMFSPFLIWQILQLKMKLIPNLIFVIHIKFTLAVSRNLSP